MGNLIVIGVVALVAYLVACWLWPYTACPQCKGGGKRMSPTGKNWGDCRRCDGRGKRIRIGRRIWDAGTNR